MSTKRERRKTKGREKFEHVWKQIRAVLDIEKLFFELSSQHRENSEVKLKTDKIQWAKEENNFSSPKIEMKIFTVARRSGLCDIF